MERHNILQLDAKGRITLPPEIRKRSSGLFTYEMDPQGVVQLRPVVKLVTADQALPDPAKAKEAVAKITRWISRQRPKPIALYGFGSFFENPSAKAEDIDLGLFSRKRLPNTKRWEWQQELAGILGKNVDLVDLQSASTVMRAEVVATGQLLFCSDEAECHRFETMVYASYCLLNGERHEIVQGILKRGNVYG